VITFPECCPACDPIRAENVVAVSQNDATRYQDSKVCGEIGCAPCIAPGQLGKTSQYFVATCRDGRCVPVDIRETDVTACATGDDCSLRVGAGCCPTGDSAEVVAIGDHGALVDLVCDGLQLPCPSGPPLPPSLVAVCEGGRCAVRERGP
jgi:hypothetical protein